MVIADPVKVLLQFFAKLLVHWKAHTCSLARVICYICTWIPTVLHLCVSQRRPYLHEIMVRETEVHLFFSYQLPSRRQGKHNQCDTVAGALCAFTVMLARRTSEGLQPNLPPAAGSGSLSCDTFKDGGWSRLLQCCSTLLPSNFSICST